MTDSLKEQKKALRRQIALLKKQHQAEAGQQSVAIITALEAHPVFQAAHTVLLYHSLPDEVCTHTFIRTWSATKKILLPVVAGEELELRLYTGPQDLTIGSYGILEPVGKTISSYTDIDLIVVPGVAFDYHGYRLGRGKGYYDRLLPHLPQAYKLGICFPYQLLPHLPAESFDIAMDEVLTIQPASSTLPEAK